MEDKDFIKVTRCKDCCSYIPLTAMMFYGFSDDFIEVGARIKADGYCDNINLWVKLSDYCSQAYPKKK